MKKLYKLKDFFYLHKKLLSVFSVFFLPTLLAGNGWLSSEKFLYIKEHYYIIWFFLLILLISYLVYLFFYDPRTKILLDFNDRNLSYQEIEKIKGVNKVVFIGLNNVGKTTLINSFFNEKYSNTRTQEIIGRIKILDNKKYICFIDVSGENKAQHYMGIKIADLVVFMMDHSSNESGINFKRERVEKTKEYIELIGIYIKSEKLGNKPFLFIVNKKDLWSKSKKSTENHIDIVEKELSKILNKKPEKIEYSNSNSYLGDISPKEIINKISNLLNIKP